MIVTNAATATPAIPPVDSPLLNFGIEDGESEVSVEALPSRNVQMKTKF